MAAHEPAAIKAVIERSGLEVGLAEETLVAMLADGQAVALGGDADTAAQQRDAGDFAGRVAAAFGADDGDTG